MLKKLKHSIFLCCFVLIFFTNLLGQQYPISLTVSSVNGNARLDWNNGVPTTYEIYRGTRPDALSLVHTVTDYNGGLLFYIDQLHVCAQEFFYQIRGDHSGIITWSNLVGKEIVNTELPDEPVFDSVSIDPNTQNVLMGWQPSTSVDVLGYKIYRLQNNVAQAIDSIYGKDNTFYSYPSTDPTLIYQISSFDSCGNVSPFIQQRKPFKPIVSQKPCSDSIKITWSFNNVFPIADPLRFEVWTSVNSGNYSLVDTTVYFESTYYYYYKNAVADARYTFIIKVFNKNRTSSSTSYASDTLIANIAPVPDTSIIYKTTVLDPNTVELTIRPNFTKPFSELRVMFLDSANLWQNLMIIPYKNAQPEMKIFHNTRLTNKQSINYRVEALDTCYQKTTFSKTYQTLFIVIAEISETQFDIAWGGGNMFNSPVSGYLLYRITNIDTVAIPLSANSNSYSDILTNIDNITSLSYLLVSENAENAQSRSNIVTVFDETEIKISAPSAFAPQGKYPYFKPYFRVKAGDVYEFFIYDRWGNRMFYTTEINQAWNGMKDGDYVPFGNYVYIVRVIRNDVKTEKKGSVLVVY